MISKVSKNHIDNFFVYFCVQGLKKWWAYAKQVRLNNKRRLSTTFCSHKITSLLQVKILKN
jgi:serine acetyltransferase